MNRLEKIKYTIFNLSIFHKGLISILVNRFICFIHICLALFGANPGFAGQRRIAYRVLFHLLNGEDEVLVKPSGFYSSDRLLDCPRFHMMKFIPSEGITFSSKEIHKIEEALKQAVIQKDPLVSRRYYRLEGLAWFIVSGYFFGIILLCSLFISEYWTHSLMNNFHFIVWISPSVFFFSQAIIFYITRLNHFSLVHSFSEAGAEEAERLKCSDGQPYVISVVPAHMEDPALLKRTLYSLCLQSYRNMRVVLLLGNDVFSTDEKVRANTKDVRYLAAQIKLDLRKQRAIVAGSLKKLSIDTISEKPALAEGFYRLGNLYLEIAGWFFMRAEGIEADCVKYPFDAFTIEHAFLSQHRRLKEQSHRCFSMAKELQDDSGDALGKYSEAFRMFYAELSRMFSIKLEVFMRTRYENLEQEKTKAGNLTAYSSIIGGTWQTKKQPDGRLALLPSENGKHIKAPEYFASFDSDTVLKPDYILRKVAFLERKENHQVGLIQSPYVVPSPEQTNVASASGVHSCWFVPMSVGFSPIKSAYWLGFNGVIRFEAVRRIKTFITDTIIEDTQNSIKMKQEGYSIVTSPEESCMTFSPSDLGALKVQRIRWSSGGFKIAANLLASMWKGNSGLKGFWEKVLSINYVMGLNFLPIAVLILTFLKSPFHSNVFIAELIPFFLYLVSYIALMRSQTRYKAIHAIDGLALNTMLMAYYVAGTLNSLGQLIFAGKTRFYKSTPKDKRLHKKWIGNLEFFGAVIIILWSWVLLVDQFSRHIYFNFFPLLQITLALYAVDRFYGWEQVLPSILQSNKMDLIRELGAKAKNALKGVRNQKFTGAFKVSFLFFCLMVFGFVSISMAADFKYRDKLKKDVQCFLYQNAESRPPLDPFEQDRRLGKGINIASALEAPQEGTWLLTLKEEYFETIKKAGFDTIRLPIRWSAHASKKSPYTIDERFFERIDWVLLQAKKNKLNIVLDLHNYDELCSKQTIKHYARFVGIWKQIAERYKDCDGSIYYELVNEPHDYLTPESWNELLSMTLSAIREIDRYHTIIIDAPLWGNAYGIRGVEIPAKERNVIGSFHTYTPQMFTHQGAEYVPEEFRYSKGVVWPGPPEKYVEIPGRIRKYERAVQWFKDYNTLPYEENPAGPKPILNELDTAMKYGQEHNIPIWLGEFGAIRYADEESKIRWTQFVAREAEKRGMTWAYWDFADTCRIYDFKKGKWDEGLLKALLGN